MCLCLQLTVAKTESSFAKPDSERQSLASALFSGIESNSSSSHIVLQVVF